MAQITAPASVALTFESVKVVTVTETDSIEKPKEVPQPNYKGSGALLSGDCKKTAFTLVDAGSTAYWAGFNGCQGDKPECCPYTVATPTATPTVNTRGPDRNSGNALGFDFPRPADDGRQTMLKKCADDYYSISGGCCPNGYWLYTTNVGGQTPCYKSISSTATPPALTIGLEDEASDIFKPTSAVVNIVWSMRYPVESSSSGLSTGAKAGIGAGAGVAIILIAVLAICLWRSRRKTRQLESAHAAQSAQVPPPQYQEQQPTVINGEHPSNHFGASVGMSSSSPLTPQGTGVSATSSQKPPGYFNGAPIPGMPYGAVSPIVVANGIAYASPTAEAQDGQGFGQYQPPPPQYPGDNTPQQQPQPQVQLYSPPGQSYSSPQPQQYSPLPSQQQGLPQGQYYFLPQQPQSPQLGYPLQGYQQPAQGFQPQQAPHNGDMTRNVPMTEMSPQRRGDVS
ncbi:hypothetical protein B0H67DRAFT_139730 [Lasiosphaeris hirsuta]|uniref:Uncharacterized protein n=1 Tax=Lasiosphaeris hirsuta TaxID=260670 RepID=A0AA40B145_9PEZI|nr:hypothetical protein B0H67DRAFT_139730 [Lasiosphaeris hirsuta]